MPGIGTAYNYLGMILEELEQVQPAIDAYLKAIELNPRFFAARENLANARLRLEEAEYRQASLEDMDRPAKEEESRSPDENGVISEIDESQELDFSGDGNEVPGWVYMDEYTFLLSGWPGHRTRPGRSGYDPLDLDFEEAHMEGVMIRLMLDGKFRTHNPFYLLLMILVGCMLSLPLLLLGAPSFLQGDNFSILVICVFSPYWIVGIALLRNVFLSFNSNKPDEANRKGNAFF